MNILQRIRTAIYNYYHPYSLKIIVNTKLIHNLNEYEEIRFKKYGEALLYASGVQEKITHLDSVCLYYGNNCLFYKAGFLIPTQEETNNFLHSYVNVLKDI